jgi:hypothetical protein
MSGPADASGVQALPSSLLTLLMSSDVNSTSSDVNSELTPWDYAIPPPWPSTRASTRVRVHIALFLKPIEIALFLKTQIAALASPTLWKHPLSGEPYEVNAGLRGIGSGVVLPNGKEAPVPLQLCIWADRGAEVQFRALLTECLRLLTQVEEQLRIVKRGPVTVRAPDCRCENILCSPRRAESTFWVWAVLGIPLQNDVRKLLLDVLDVLEPKCASHSRLRVLCVLTTWELERNAGWYSYFPSKAKRPSKEDIDAFRKRHKLPLRGD